MACVITLIITLFASELFAVKNWHDYFLSTGSRIYPSAKKTPGDIFEFITKEDVCKPGYARSVRHVSGKTKKDIKFSYKIPTEYYKNYIVDHFIPLSLGGTNETPNLWPQANRGTMYGAEQKTKSDGYLFSKVCDGSISLEDAQNRIRNDWVAVYIECCTDTVMKYKRQKLNEKENGWEFE